MPLGTRSESAYLPQTPGGDGCLRSHVWRGTLRMSDDRLMEWKLVRCLFSGSAGRKIKEKKQRP
jgi:hypothetical protein